jgi:hypothetical protein
MAYNFPPVGKIFDDLDKFRDFCRYEGYMFDEKDLYNFEAQVWQLYQRHVNYLKSKTRNRYNNTGNFNREGGGGYNRDTTKRYYDRRGAQ